MQPIVGHFVLPSLTGDVILEWDECVMVGKRVPERYCGQARSAAKANGPQDNVDQCQVKPRELDTDFGAFMVRCPVINRALGIGSQRL